MASGKDRNQRDLATAEWNQCIEKVRNMKTCTSCAETKEDKLFEKDNRNKSGVGSRCKKCEIIRRKKHRPSATGLPRGKANVFTSRQDKIVKYGIAVFEVMEGLDNS